MEISIEQLSGLTAIYLGEYSAFRFNSAVMQNSVQLQEMVAIAAAPLLVPMTMALSLRECTDTVDFRKYLCDNTDFGYGDILPCTLPSDFLRLHSLWMPDWPSPLTDEILPDTLRLELGENAPDWLSSRTTRPLYRIVDIGDGIKEMWFGPTKQRHPRQATYIPIPVYDKASDTILNIQPAVIEPLAAKIAESIGVN